MERWERADSLVNLREVAKMRWERNLPDFEKRKTFLLRQHKSYKYKLDNNTKQCTIKKHRNYYYNTDENNHRKGGFVA